MKKLIILLAGISLVTTLSACSSKEAVDDVDSDAAVEDLLNVDTELEASDGDTAYLEGGPEEASEGFLDEQLPEDALGENEFASPEPAIAEPAITDSDDQLAGVDMGDTGGTGFTEMEEPPAPAPIAETEPEPVTESSSAFEPQTEVADTLPAKRFLPLRKVEAAPFRRSGQLLNAVYVARPGDTYASISQRIFGTEDRASTLAEANPIFKSPKPGDKIYYNSPMRPLDDRQMLTYYEDMGLVPEIYVAQDGENLRSVSKRLLGYDNAWKEVWAINGVESKDTLMGGTELRYWKGSEAISSQPLAQVQPPPSQPIMNTPPPMDMPLPSEPPPVAEFDSGPDLAMSDLPPPDMGVAGGMNDPMESMPPPDLPPPPPAMVNPPPPATPEAPAMAESGDLMGDVLGGMDQDMVFAIGGGAILLLGLVFLRIARKRRQEKEMAAAFNDTQVGT